MSNSNIFSNALPVFVKAPEKFQFSPDESSVGLTQIPAMTCNLSFSQGGKHKNVHTFKLGKDVVLPENWNNYTPDKTDTDTMKRLKANTIRPVNQGLCGSCYAVSISTTISDNFLFGMKLKHNPFLSPMYILSCLPDNAQCKGGNPSLVLDDITNKGGLPSNCSQDYYKLCDANKGCNGKGENHLDKKKDNPESSKTPDEIMEEMIPKCGHCEGDIPKMYKIKNKTLTTSVPFIKTHLMQFGAVIGGFVVYANFIHADNTNGIFSSTKGIYIHSVNYVTDKTINRDDILGGHAISIVGWGVEKDVTAVINNNTYVYPKVEYWVCRNSWSANWGEKGYFKYAMYQTYKEVDKNGTTFPDINKNVAFETKNVAENGMECDGILTVEPDTIVTATKDQPIFNKTTCDTAYTCTPPIANLSDGGLFDGDLSVGVLLENRNIIYLIYGCLFIIVAICLYYLFGGKDGKGGKGRKGGKGGKGGKR